MLLLSLVVKYDIANYNILPLNLSPPISDTILFLFRALFIPPRVKTLQISVSPSPFPRSRSLFDAPIASLESASLRARPALYKLYIITLESPVLLNNVSSFARVKVTS